MEKNKLSHDVLNVLERLRIMHDLARDRKFELVSQEELKQDFLDSIKKLEKDFLALLQ